MKQYKGFVEAEGDNWFVRCKDRIGKGIIAEKTKTVVASIQPKILLDIGCSNGGLTKQLKANEIYGIDVSKKAIADANSLNFMVMPSHSLRFDDNKFDVVVLHFMLHWLDRHFLEPTIVEIKRVLKQGGHLVINDFYAKKPVTNKYKHRENLYTYKRDYIKQFSQYGFNIITKERYNKIYAIGVLKHANKNSD